MLSATLVWNRIGSCSISVTCRRSEASVSSRRSWPSSVTRPCCGIEEAQHEAGERALAGAGARPRARPSRPRAIRSVTSLSTGRRVVVAEAHVLQSRISPAHGAQRVRARARPGCRAARRAPRRRGRGRRASEASSSRFWAIALDRLVHVLQVGEEDREPADRELRPPSPGVAPSQTRRAVPAASSDSTIRMKSVSVL